MTRRNQWHGTKATLFALPSGQKPIKAELCVITDTAGVPTGEIYVGMGPTLDPIPQVYTRPASTKPNKFLTIKTHQISSNGNQTFTLRYSGTGTGIAYSVNGSAPTVVTGAVDANISVVATVGVNAEVSFWPTNGPEGYVASDANLTRFSTQSALSEADISNLPALTYLSIASGSTVNQSLASIGWLDLEGCPALETLQLRDTNLTSIDAAVLPSLQTLSLNNLSQLTRVNLTGLSNLTSLLITDTTAFSDLDLTDLTSCTSVVLRNTQVESVDLTPTNLYSCDISNNSNLTSLIIGNQMNYGATQSYGNWLNNNALDAAGLNAMYTSILAGSTGAINVSGNPGTGSDDPSIATTRGVAVFGS